MNRNLLYEKRIAPALDELYRKADNPFGRTFSWDEMMEAGHKLQELPWYAFCVDHDVYTSIKKDATRYLRSRWIWPYKIYYVFSDSEIESKQRDIEHLRTTDPENWLIAYLQEQIDFNPTARDRNAQFDEYQSDLSDLDARLASREIDRKQYNKEMRKLAKLYHLHRRSWDREYVEYNITNFGPTYDREAHDRLVAEYEKVKDDEVLNGMVGPAPVEAELRRRGLPDRISYDLTTMIEFKKIVG